MVKLGSPIMSPKWYKTVLFTGVTKQGRRLAPSLGGPKKFSRTTKISERAFPGKIYILTPKNSDDIFLVIDQVFLILTLSFQILCIFIVSNVVSNVVYDPFFTTKCPLSTKNSLTTPIFLLGSSFRAHPTTLLLKILGDQCMGRPPPQILGDCPSQVSTPVYTLH